METGDGSPTSRARRGRRDSNGALRLERLRFGLRRSVYGVRHVQTRYSKLANFQSLDFCAADDEPANRYKSDRDRAERNSADRNRANRLRTYGQRTKGNRAECSLYFLNFL